MRIISGTVGLLYSLIVPVPKVYDAFSGSSPVKFPECSSTILRTLSFGYIENLYKVYFYTLCFLSTRTSQDPYSTGYIILISLTMLSSMINVFYFNAYSPIKESIPKELIIDLEDPKIQGIIKASNANPAPLESK